MYRGGNLEEELRNIRHSRKIYSVRTVFSQRCFSWLKKG